MSLIIYTVSSLGLCNQEIGPLQTSQRGGNVWVFEFRRLILQHGILYEFRRIWQCRLQLKRDIHEIR